MSKLRFFLLTGFLAAAVAPLYGCGSECGPGTTEQDGECVLVAEGCGDGTILSDKKCIVDTFGCGEGTTLDEGQCVPHERSCADGTTFDQALRVCVPNTDIVCGEATEANDDGICEPSGEACAPKTVLDEQGRCIVEAAACGEGTELDPNSGVCILSDAACGDGLAIGDDGQCVPTEDVCDVGTAFDADSGLCLPDACAEGDVLVNGVCMNPVEQDANDADLTETENNDPALGGTAESLTINPVDGDAFSFAGTIGEPTDLDGDSKLDQDVDVFEFDASAGDWLQIGVQSNGLPAPAFTVEGPNGYMRWSQTTGAPQTARHIVIPEDGTYSLTVLPSLRLQGAEVGAAGAEGWGYVGTIKAIAVPTPTDKDISSGTPRIDGDLTDLSDNLFNITNLNSSDLVTLTTNSIGADSDAVVQVWADATTLHASQPLRTGETMTFAAPSTGTAWVLVDWTKAKGPRVGFDFGLSITGETTTVTLADGATATLTVPVELFERIVASQDNTGGADLAVRILDPSNTEVEAATLAPGEELPTIAFDTGDYTVEATNNSGASVDVTLQANVLSPQDLGAIPADGSATSTPIRLPKAEKAYYKFTAPADQVIAFFQDNLEGGGVDFTIFDETGTEIDGGTSLAAYSDLTEFSPTDYIWNYTDTAVTWLLETEAASDLTGATVEVHSHTPTDLGPLDTTGTDSVTNNTAIPTELSGFHRVTFSEATNYHGLLSPNGGEDLDFFLYDLQGSQLASTTGSGGDVPFGGGVDAAGAFIVRIECDEACNGYSLTMSGTPPVEDLGLLGGNTVTTTTVIPFFGSDQTYRVNFSVAAGHIIELGHDNDNSDDQKGYLYDATGTEVGYENFFYPLSYTGFTGPERIHHYSENGGDYTFVLEGRSSTPNQWVEIRVIEPTALGPVTQAGGTVTNNDPLDVLENQWYVHEVTFNEAGVFTGAVRPAVSSEEIDLALYDMQFNEIDSWSNASGDLSFGGPLDAAGTYLFVAECADGSCTGVDFEVGLVDSEVDLGTLAADSTTDHTVGNFYSGQPLTLRFNVPAGQVIEVSHVNDEDEDHDVYLYDANGEKLASDTLFQPRGYSSPDYVYWYAQAGGDFSIEFVGDNPTTNQMITIRTITPGNLGTLTSAGNSLTTTSAQACADGQSYFHLATFTDPMTFDGTLSPAATEDLDFYLHTTSNDEVIYEYSSGGADVSFNRAAPLGGTYLVEIECDDPATGYTLTLENGAAIEEPLGSIAADSSLSSPTYATYSADEAKSFSFDVQAGQIIEISQDNTESDDHDLYLYDANGNELDSDTLMYASSRSFGGDFVYGYAENGGTYYALLVGADSVTDQTVTIRSYTPTAVGPMVQGDSFANNAGPAMVENQRAYHVVTLSTDGFLHLSGTANNDIDYFIEATDMTSVASSWSSGGIDDIVELKAGTYLIAVEPNDDITSYEFELFLSGPPSLDHSSAPGVAIPDNDTTGVSDTLTASGCASIDRVFVYLDISHTWRSDLDIDLTSPAGTTVRIREDSGGFADDVLGWIPFDDTSAEPLSAFRGEAGDGTWTLTVYDDASGDTGTLNEWGLDLNCQ